MSIVMVAGVIEFDPEVVFALVVLAAVYVAVHVAAIVTIAVSTWRYSSRDRRFDGTHRTVARVGATVGAAAVATLATLALVPVSGVVVCVVAVVWGVRERSRRRHADVTDGVDAHR